MRESLFVSLIYKCIIKKGTRLGVNVKKQQFVGSGFIDTYDTVIIENARKRKNGKIYINAKSETDKTYHIIESENICDIDGMDPVRLASVHNIKPDGTTKYVKIDPLTGEEVKRGRKPKKIKEKMNEQQRRSIQS